MEQPHYQTSWGQPFVATDCPHCDWIFLTTRAKSEQMCPHCGQEALTPLEAEDELPYTAPPELMVRPPLTKQQLASRLTKFASDIPYAPEDLSGPKLLSRLRRLYLPMWLVDVDVSGQWQAEVGYDYQVVSHRERLQNQTWRTEEVKETRIRWEPRLGELERHYANATAAALDEQHHLSRRLGDYDLGEAVDFHPADMAEAFVRLPNRPPRDAWSDAEPAVQRSAAGECQRAADGQHIRQFRWSPTFSRQDWTQLLLPVYTTYYQDDDGGVQMVMIQGQTGRLIGSARSSMKRAQRSSLIIAAIALAIGFISMILAAAGLVVAPLLVVGGIGLAAALLVMFGAAIPIGRAWQFNHSHARKTPLRLDTT